MTTPDVATIAARQQRYREEKAMGWPAEDARAFLDGARDHWPSMQALRHYLEQEQGRG